MIWRFAYTWTIYTISLLLLLSYHPSTATQDAQQPLQDAQHPLQPAPSQPNIIFILTDDQDLHLDSLSYMPYLKKHLTDQGTSFKRHYCTVALCCPSRVSLWTGKAAHNTNVTDVNPPYGGWPKFLSQGLNEAYLPVWLQELEYETYYVGKLFNAQTVDNYNDPEPAAGWTGSEHLLDPYTYEYLNASFTRNAGPPTSYPGQYSTDLIRSKSFAFLSSALANPSSPFFLTIAPTAPHSNVHQLQGLIHGNFTEKSNIQSPPVPAARHAHLFANVTVPRTPHFNPDSPHGVSWISRLPQQNQTNIDFNDHFYRSRLRALQSVDEMIDELFTRLEEAGVLDETYIFFSTDNGYHIGQHRLQPGKQCAFEEDINIPLIVRGPGIPRGHVSELVTTHTDLAPTFLSLASSSSSYLEEMSEKYAFDGQPIPLHTLLEAESMEHKMEHVNVEMWGIIMSEGKYGSTLYPNHTYKALRVVGEGYSLLYTVWCSGERELYDVLADPYQTSNLYPLDHGVTSIAFPSHRSSEEHGVSYTPFPPPPPNNVSSTHSPVPLSRLIPRLNTLLMVLKTCKQRQCTHPWSTVHPAGDIHSLRDTLDPQFDEFYAGQEEVAFGWCEKGYISEAEGAVWNDVQAYSFDQGA
ncbi:unnamed protein product [Zymoseptoria tritici ST99CH_1A5]|uniref:Arylsulfatase n=1 Tax=Zymoseptoria tritici ST99CH_1A5 TaxID=1276529 RepID=A0A1Y6LWU7_ZYMTR|nr:unnamed protein product [Zymoseptoria tritici ST99CH_1A5]